MSTIREALEKDIAGRAAYIEKLQIELDHVRSLKSALDPVGDLEMDLLLSLIRGPM